MPKIKTMPEETDERVPGLGKSSTDVVYSENSRVLH